MGFNLFGKLNPDVKETYKPDDSDDPSKCAATPSSEDGSEHFYTNRKGMALKEKTSIQAGTKTHYTGAMSVINDFGKRAQEALSRRISEIKVSLETRINRIRDLHQEKFKVMKSVYTRDELADIAVKRFIEAKERHKMSWLVKHLENCRQHKSSPFSDVSLNTMLDERDIFKLFLFLTTEDDIRAAIATLPDDGIPKKVREKELRKIEDEIQKLSLELEAEMDRTDFSMPLLTYEKKTESSKNVG
jgi:hypothetical protein